MRVGILTVSDRSFRGEREDLGGPALARAMCEGWESYAPEGQHDIDVSEMAIVPDERNQIAARLIEWVDERRLDLILTTGGTGFAPRDVTPEATLDVLDRQVPGLAEIMRAEGMRITRNAVLSRAVTGLRKRTLIVNLPGNPRGAVESLAVIMPVLPHAIELLRAEAPIDNHNG